MVTYKLIDTLNTDSNSIKVCNLKSLILKVNTYLKNIFLKHYILFFQSKLVYSVKYVVNGITKNNKRFKHDFKSIETDL